MNQEKYNGWANYATWRVNLEMFDGYTIEQGEFETITDLADSLKEIAEESISCDNKLANDYADAFLSEVNFYEIAKAVAENNNVILN